jgi:uncharacterized protein (DUF58 family)
MTPLMVAAIALVVIGAFLRVPVIVILGLIAGALEAAHMLWARRGLTGVRYSRRLAAERMNWGNEIEMRIEVWNRKRLPLAWLRAVEEVSSGVSVRHRPGAAEETVTALRNTWTLAPFERVVRHVWVTANRRGVHSIGPTHVSVGDLLARDAAGIHLDAVDHFVVWPRVVPALGLARPDRWGDADRATFGLIEDPARFAGVRPYSPGDPMRRIHARTSARLGRPMTKRFEPSRERQLLVALDIQTVGGRDWDMLSPGGGDVEALYVVAASLVRSLAADGASFGLTAAGFTRTPTTFADVGIGSGANHADRVLDVLARLSPYPSAPFSLLLARIRRRYRGGTTVLIVTMRDPRPFLEDMRRLRRAGFGVIVLTCGPAAAEDALSARRAGFKARAAQLDGPWQTATRLAGAA